METVTNSKKIEFALKDQGRSKTWLANKLGITRPSMYSKLKDNSWTNFEIHRLKQIGLI